MAVFTYNVRSLDADIRRLLTEYKGIRHTAMVKVADFLREEAQYRCPFDKGNLHGDITGRTETYLKSESAIVYVPVNAPSAQYAIPMHEHTYNLGKESLAHPAKTHRVVGPGYLTRAITENTDAINDRIIDTLATEMEKMV